MERAEFPEKKLLREVAPALSVVVNDYWPDDRRLKELKKIFLDFCACEHERHREKLVPIYTALGNLVVKLADRDQHYKLRLFAFAELFRSWMPELRAEERAWVEAFLRRGRERPE